MGKKRIIAGTIAAYCFIIVFVLLIITMIIEEIK